MELKNSNKNGIIIAPAGCGKTESIVNLIKEYTGDKKILVLTHTNAGIENIERRLRKKKISTKKCNIYTIASFCSIYVTAFRVTSKIYDNSYEQIYSKMDELMNNNHIKNIIKNTYELMLVDEYQDCNLIQHSIIRKVSKLISYKIYGDPLQAIYNFEKTNIKFEHIINKDYELLENMTYPWRWKNCNYEMGNWINLSREKLIENDLNIFNSLPNGVEVFKYDNYQDLCKKAIQFSYYNGRNVILFNLENQANTFCKKLGGRFFFQEEIECKALKNLIEYIDNKNVLGIVKEFIKISKMCFTNFLTEYNNVVNKVEKNNFDFKGLKTNKELANLISTAIVEFKLQTLIEMADVIDKNTNLKLYRKELWEVLKKLLKELLANNRTAKETLILIRNSKINNNNFKYKNMVSRILLVKGLEFENVFIVNPDELTKELLYVAISRPTQRLIIAEKE